MTLFDIKRYRDMVKIIFVFFFWLSIPYFSLAQTDSSILERQCSKGSASSCYKLGHRYRTGEGGTQDLSLAFKFYEKACDLNNAAGCSGLGYLYTLGRGIEKDTQAALTSFLKSCDLKEIIGCAGAGNILIGGSLDNRNRQKGIKLLRHACSQKYDWACNRLRAYEIPLKPGRKYR